MENTNCDPAFRAELDRINTELELENAMSEASEEMEIEEILSRARLHGDSYGAGFEDGFWAGRQLLIKYMQAEREASHEKHSELIKRWGLDKL